MQAKLWKAVDQIHGAELAVNQHSVLCPLLQRSLKYESRSHFCLDSAVAVYKVEEGPVMCVMAVQAC